MKKRGKAASIPGQPTREEFVSFARQRGIDPKRAGDQWDCWDMGDWCDGNNTPILNWKLKLGTYAKQGFGTFSNRGYSSSKQPLPEELRDHVAEANEEYEQRKRHEWPEDL